MPDETNLTNEQESAQDALPDDLFEEETESGDSGGEDDSWDSADDAAEEQTDSEGAKADDKFYSVKYNGKEIKLTEKELVTNAQKGLNYDHVKNELESLRNSPERKWIEDSARKRGMTPEQFMRGAMVRDGQEELTRLLHENPGNERMAREVWELRQRERARQSESLAVEARNARSQQWIGFLKEHPDMTDFAKIPDEVKESVASGENVTSAYRAWENRQLKDKLKMLEQNAHNREKSPGSVRSDAKPRGEDDPFLQGFFAS